MEKKRLAISVEETGRMLGISRAKAYELARSSTFPSIRVGGRLLVPIAQLEAWIAQHAEGPKEEVK